MSSYVIGSQNLPYTTGQWAGSILVLCLLLWGFLRVSRNLLSPYYSQWAIVGCLMPLTFWILAAIANILKQQAGIVVFSLVMGFIIIAALPIGLIASVVGLYKTRVSAKTMLAGRRTAWAGLIINLFFLISVAVGFTAQRSQRSVEESLTATSASSPGEMIISEDMNFGFRLPGWPWTKLDAKKMNPMASLFIMRTRPHMVFMVIAERTAVGLDAEQLAEVVQGNLKSTAERAEFGKTERIEGLGYDCLQFKAKARIAGSDSGFVFRIIYHKGFVFQLITQCGSQDARQLPAESEKLMSRFEILDPDLTTGASIGKPAGDLRSDIYGYTLPLGGKPQWCEWPDADEGIPLIDSGALIQSWGAVAVLPIHLRGESVHFESVAQGLLAAMDVAYPSSAIKDMRRVEQSGLSGRAFSLERAVGGTEYVYRFRLLLGKDVAYLLAGWVDKAAVGEIGAIEAALESVEFDAEPPAAQPLEEMEPWKRTAQGLAFNSMGLFYHASSQHGRAASLFRLAFEMATDDPVLLSNMLDSLTRLGRNAEALSYLDKHLAAFEEDVNLQAWKARLLRLVGREREALDAYAAVDRIGWPDENALCDYVDILTDGDGHDVAIAAMERYLADSPSRRLTILHANVHGWKGDYERAVALMESARERWGDMPDVLYDLAENYLGAEQYSAAIEIADELIGRGHDSAYARNLKGRGEYGLKWYKEAKESFEAALARDATDSGSRRWLEAADNMLGLGSHLSVKAPIDAVAIPEELFDAKVPPDFGREHGAFYRWLIVAVDYPRSTERKMVEILDADAIDAFSTLQASFDPGCEELHVNLLVVRDGDGRVISEGSVEDYYILDDASSDIPSGKKTLHMPVKGLAPGRTIEWIVTRRDLGAGEGFRFTQHVFSKSYPVVSSSIFVRSNVSLTRHAFNAGEPESVGGGLLWRVYDPPVWRDEPRTADWRGFAPHVALVDAASDWASIAEEYLEELAEVTAPAEGIVELAAEITSDARTPVEKMTRVARYIQKEFTYKAIAFGRRATIPRTVSEIVQSRYGDCKDLALLGMHLLRELGFEAHLVLASFGDSILPELPALFQFDHMIVLVTGPEGDRYLDFTDRNGDLLAGAPIGLGGTKVLVLDPAGSRLADVPRYPEGSSIIRIERSVSVTDGTDADVRERFAASGYYASSFRGWLRQMIPAERLTAVQRNLNDQGASVRLIKLDVKGLDDPAAELILDMRYVVRGALVRGEDRLMARIPALWERDYLRVAGNDRRCNPFHLQYPLAIESETRVFAPRDYLTAGLQDAAGTEDDFISWSYRPSDSAGEPSYFRAELKTGVFAPDRWNDFHDSVENALRAIETPLVFQALRSNGP